MSTEHKVTSTDEQVRGYPGTVARCECGWSSAWAVQDGSAESDANRHMRAMMPGFAEEQDAYQAEFLAKHEAWRAEQAAKYAAIEGERKARTNSAVQALTSKRCHDCSCHINPPCGKCENCVHIDYPECPNDCQECEIPHDHP